VKEFSSWTTPADELLHPPDKPAGVERQKERLADITFVRSPSRRLLSFRLKKT
jgi:hypothetical protein